MKKLFIFLIAFFTFISCEKIIDESTKEVRFSANKFGVESGSLKSFDINEWKHFHYPYTVTVYLVNKESGIKYTSSSPNATVFFNQGTDPIHLPYGAYDCSVDGGGYPIDGDAYSASYYIWTIKDTTINISDTTTIITFNLDKTPALLVRDADVEINYVAIDSKNDSLHWTGRGKYDFAYVTPWVYAGIYTNEYGNDVTVIFEAKKDNYYYFVIPDVDTSSTTTNVNIPDFTGQEIKF
jgi:hypothetical protein